MHSVKEIRTERYSPECKSIWNDLIDNSVNGSFLFKRSFMDYHQDKFEDFSYLVWQENKLLAVFAAAIPRQRIDNSTLIAHPGLTYGGLVYGANLRYLALEQIYNLLLNEFIMSGFGKVVIKLIPSIFCKNNSDSDSFILNKIDFNLSNREINSVLNSSVSLHLSKNKNRNINNSIENKISVTTSDDYKYFWNILIKNLLQRYDVGPVHTLSEIEKLANDNPANIKLYAALKDEAMVAGVVTFSDTRQGYVHAQYIAANEVGKVVGAVDAVLLHVIQEAMAKQQRFSFGISSVNGKVNYGLLRHKEGFGATVEVMDTYEKYI